MRAIDADAMIDRLKGWDTKDKTDKALYNFTLNRINEQATIQPEPHWIPVTERLPEVSGCYLVSVKNDHERRYSKTAWFGGGVWFARQDVLAWMPLPDPYKGVTE